MASYHIWHPAYVNDHSLTLEAFITLGDALLPSRGSESFTKAALQALGLAVTPRTWRIDAMRTHYFASYREDSRDWRDAWDLTWRLRATIAAAHPPRLPDTPDWGYFDLDASGGSYVPDDDSEYPCLLIADARHSSTIEAAQSIIARAHRDAAFVRGQAFTRFPQLRCQLGERPRAWYESRAPEAEATLKAIAATGASVRFDGLDAARRQD